MSARRVHPPAGPAGGSRLPVFLAAGVVVAVAAGWFLLSLLAAHNDPRTAVRETVGVCLALLVLVSMVGAVRDGRRRRPGGE